MTVHCNAGPPARRGRAQALVIQERLQSATPAAWRGREGISKREVESARHCSVAYTTILVALNGTPKRRVPPNPDPPGRGRYASVLVGNPASGRRSQQLLTQHLAWQLRVGFPVRGEVLASVGPCSLGVAVVG